ncbi:GGDEF domain-containing protein [Actinoplanes sp. NEAU-H7]|uniref:GGDEF domain-containing protein n=2 Tax=Actinoplanes flavus TaxID=2820290 RepID=A0ABS3UW38_9ACTN|nr:GGDEF domain-containing protein [Actinoplanes flavus]
MDPGASRRWTRHCVAVGALFLVVAVLVMSRAGGTATAGAVGTWALLAGAAMAAGACVWRSLAFTGRSRWAWALLAAGLLTWGFAQFTWLARRWVPGVPEVLAQRGVEDIGLAGLGLLIPAALLTMPRAAQPLANRVRSVLDGLLIASSLVLLAWIFVMDDLAAGAHGPRFYLTLFFPLADVVIATMVAYMLPLRRDRRGFGADLTFVCAGLIAFAVADAGHVYLHLVHDFGGGPIVHLGWLAGYALITMGALRPRVADDAPLDLPPGVWSTAVMMPYLTVIAALGASVMLQLQTGHVPTFVGFTRSFLILLLIGRQLLTQLENRALTRGLETRVADRTAELYAREQHFHALIRHSSDVITVIDSSGVIRYQSESMQRVFGYPAAVFLGRRYTDLVDAEVAMRLAQAMRQVAARPFASVTLEVVHTHQDGRKRPSEAIITNLVDDPHVAGFVLNTRDISDRMELQEQLVHEAYHDSLTQLANRALFRERTAATLESGATATVLHLDMDGFKRVNDSLGHLAGDQLLVRLADRLRGCLREEDLVARFGADEFGVLLTGDDGAEEVARRILGDLDAPIMLGARQIHVRASIGLAGTDLLEESADTHGDRAEQLMRNADLAMHHAKAVGGGVFAPYRPRMRDGLVERLELESELRAALENGELRLHYQPTVDLETSRVIGFEALVRWPHPTRGMISPLDFIPIAEATGLIVPLGRWVLREACCQAVEWSAAAGGRPLKMSVNVSVRQFDRADLAETVAGVLAETGMPADRLCLEMTESVLMTDTEANLEQLVRLKGLGLTLAIDDFGTGYSSLAYLRRFPVDTLKIDRSFVERLGVIADDTALTDTIVRLGRSLGMATVAEGIEEFGQLAVLREMGCGFAQGYYFSRPVPADEAGRLFLEGAHTPA